jgi:hypothetical protein
MDGITDEQTASRGFVRSALALATCVLVVALALLPYAMRQSGSAGPMGVAAAATIVLLAGLAAEGMGAIFAGLGSPLAALLFGMAARMAPPMLICLALALQGAHGREYLAFICYLLAFYLATLALETWLAVKRVNHKPSDDTGSAR